MHSVRINTVINKIVAFYHRIGFWHRNDEPTSNDLRFKYFYCIHFSLYVISLVVGAITNENRDESIFLADVSIAIAVLTIKLWFFIWKQNRICHLTNRICVFPIRNSDDYVMYNDKLKGFLKFVILFLIVLVTFSFEAGVLPFPGDGKTLFLEIGFPLDWRTNTIAFFTANVFILTEVFLSMVVVFSSIIIWYMLLVCSLRYSVLASELKKLGWNGVEGMRTMTEQQKQHIYLQDLTRSIDDYVHLKKYVSLCQIIICATTRELKF